MAVTNQTPIGGAIGNGVTSVFPFAYYIAAAEDLVVTIEGVTQTLGVNYTVTGSGNQNGGTITLVSGPLGSGQRLAHFRNTLLQRATDYQNNGDFPAQVVNLDFDRLWLALQEIFSGGKGAPTAVRVPPGETIPELPPASERANRLIGFDSLGQPIATLPTPGDATALALDLASTASGKGAALLGFNPTLNYTAGTIGWSEASQRQWNCADFPWLAKFDGVTDDTAAITACWTALFNAGGGVLVMPAGTARCNLSFNYTASTTVSMRGAGMGATTLRAVAGSTAATLAMSSPTSILDIYSRFTDFSVRHNAKAGHGLRLTNIATFRLQNLDIRDCDVGVENLGSLIFEVVGCNIRSNNINYRCRAANSIYPNLVKFTQTRLTFGSTFGADLGECSGVNFDSCDFERNGTAGNLATGALKVRDTVDNETGFSQISLTNNTWFEANFGGHSIVVDNASGLSFVMDGVLVAASEAGRAVSVGGISSVELRGVVAASPGDTVTLAAAASSIVGGTISVLNDTSTRQFRHGCTANSSAPTPTRLDNLELASGGAFTWPANGQVRGGGNFNQGATSFMVTDGQAAGDVFIIYHSNGGAGNVSATATRTGRNGVTGRSINSAGTINASGADYAEYEIKSDDCGVFMPGDVVGFDEDGRLTDRWDRAISFGIKSTNPCVVGGDDWFTEGLISHPGNDASAEELSAYESEKRSQLERLEAARQRVDRIAYAGKVPVNITGISPGDWIEAVQAGMGIGLAVGTESNERTVGRVRAILADGRALVVVKAI